MSVHVHGPVHGPVSVHVQSLIKTEIKMINKINKAYHWNKKFIKYENKTESS